MDAKAQPLLVISVAAIMLTMGLGLAASDFRRVGASPRAVVVGLVGQLVLLPVLAFVHAWAFALPTPLAIGLVLIAAVPGGAHSNLFASFAKADIALSSHVFAHSIRLRAASRPASGGVLANVVRDFESVRDFFTSTTLTLLGDMPFMLFFMAVIGLIGGKR